MLRIVKILTILNSDFVIFSKDLSTNQVICNEINFE